MNFDWFLRLEVVEHACGMATLQMGEYVSNVSNGIDTYSVREPLGVCAGICPFNFPAMIPLWVSLLIFRPDDKPLCNYWLQVLFHMLVLVSFCKIQLIAHFQVFDISVLLTCMRLTLYYSICLQLLLCLTSVIFTRWQFSCLCWSEYFSSQVQ